MNEASQYVPGFVSNLSLVPQQKTARLVQTVMADLSHTTPGEMFNGDDIGDDDDEVEVVGRAPDSPESFGNHIRRVGFFKSYAKGRFIETLEKVRMLQDPANSIMAGMMATKQRATDRKIIEVLFGAAREGKTGETTVAYKAAQTIAVDNRDFLHDAESVAASGALPLTLGKIIKASVMLDKAEIEGERYFAFSATQKGNLLATTPATSSDYAQVKALVNGEINTMHGFTFVRSEQLPHAGGVRSCAAYVKPAVMYKERPIENAWIERRKDKSGRWYAYYEVERGGLRRYDEGVIKVECAEA